jgi:hypothetical protein
MQSHHLSGLRLFFVQTLATIPPSHPLNRNSHIMSAADLDTDAGLVDLFLHATDVAQDAALLDALVHRAGLVTMARLPRTRTDPRLVLPSPAEAPMLHALLPTLNATERALLCELWSGSATRHTLLATRPSVVVDPALTFQHALAAVRPGHDSDAVVAAAWTALGEWVLVPFFMYPEDIARLFVPVPGSDGSRCQWHTAWSHLPTVAATALPLVLLQCDGERPLRHVYDHFVSQQRKVGGDEAAHTVLLNEFVTHVRALWELLESLGLLVASRTPFPLLWEHSYK